jgi:hypothetical protein
MLRTRLGAAGLVLAPLILPTSVATAANVASPAVNPAARVAATTVTGNVSTTASMNDGATAGGNSAAVFVVPTQIQGAQTRPGSRGFGYDLGGTVTVESLDLSQYVGGSSRGARARLADVVVHTAAGTFAAALPDQDAVTITLPAPVATSWVTLETNTQHDGADPAIGIAELAVNASNGITPRRANVALGRPVTLLGTGWGGTGDLTDNVLAGATSDLSTSRVNASGGATSLGLDIDLGAPSTINGLGLAENDYGTSGGRRLAQGVRLLFADDPTFTTVNGTRDLTLANIPYQQVDFDPATGRYVRLTLLSRYANRDESFGVTEVQLFAVPEPTAVGLVLPVFMLLRRTPRERIRVH